MPMSPTTRSILRAALPLIRTHGFTREAIAHSVLNLPEGGHGQPLSDSAVTALFGRDEDARRTLINAWLEEGIREMEKTASQPPTLRDVLQTRLTYNEPVLRFLPEAFGVLSHSKSALHVIDPVPMVKHAHRVADEACIIIGDKSLQLEWHLRRASIAAIYASAELHQLTSPHTALPFLDTLLTRSDSTEKIFGEVAQYTNYIFRSWKGIINSLN